MTTNRYDYRCPRCGRLLFRATLPDGSKVDIRCPKCGAMAIIAPNGKDSVQIEDKSLETT